MEKIKELSIKEEQQIHLKILEFFNDICQREHLRYFLAYGTLLGAVREKGFIEWDDDIDLWMIREDYEKFAAVFPKYSTDEYFLQNYQTDPNCVSPEMMRICVNGTFKWPNGCEREKFHTGLYFDIFPLDYGFGNDQDKEDLNYSTKIHRSIWRTLRERRKNTLKSKLYEFYTGLLPRGKYIRKYVDLVQSHRDCKSDVFLVFAGSFAGLGRSYFKTSYFEKTKWVPFEDLILPIPEDSDELLRYMYGDDYMTPAKTKPHRTKAYLIK